MKIFRVFNVVAVFFIRGYQICVSPILPNVCRFEPSCSAYALECFRRFSFFKALRLTLKRLLRCHPFCAGGYDPVPERVGNTKGRGTRGRWTKQLSNLQ
ncbi:MAG TPA: membrane protein insertion efficiency factor YidD [bacterium]|nr:membrane protein insertion efficiency factor YidD [bacterium]